MRKQYLSFLLLTLLPALLLGGCARTPQRLSPTPLPAPVTLPDFVTLSGEEAIPQLIAAEREASRSGDRALLAQLWAEDARIVDTRGTDDPSDDFTWPNRAAILDRYMLAVFPAPPPALAGLPLPETTVQGDEAQVKRLEEHRVKVAFRGTGIRVGIHFYNNTGDIDRLVEVWAK